MSDEPRVAVPGHGNDSPEISDDFSAAFDEVAAKAEAREAADHGAQDNTEPERGADPEADFSEAFDDAAVNAAAARGEEAQEESLIEKVKRLEAANAKLEQSERSQRGRVSALTKKLLDQKKAAPEPEPPKDGQGAEGVQPDGEGDWDEFKREFPEMAAIVEQRIAKVEQRVESVGREVGAVKSTADILAEKEIIAHKEQQYSALANDFGHDDYQDVLASQEWQQWRAAAGEDIQQKIKSHDAEDAAAVLDAFKKDTGWKTTTRRTGDDRQSEVEKINARREQALKRSAGIPARKIGHRPKGEESEDDFDTAFAARAGQIERDRALLR